MFIKELNLINFRNYIQESINFESNKVILIGKNAQGKSNLLELIQVFSLAKSKRATRDRDLVNFDAEDAVVHLRALKNSPEFGDELINISLQIRRSGKRTVKINEITKKPSELVGNIFSVSFMVDDLEVVYGSPSKRREWIDGVLIQLSQSYRDRLSAFENALKQRNSYIKRLVEQGVYFTYLNDQHKSELAVWDDLFIATANQVIEMRIELVDSIKTLAQDYYSKIAKKLEMEEQLKLEKLELNYAGALLTNEDLKESLAKDFARGFTNIGPHRHDVDFTIDGHLASQFASQGQRRTVMLALKLSELDLLKNKYQDSPILLLDDVLAELDEDRQDFLLDAVQEDTQVVITTTHLGEHLAKWQDNAQIFTVSDGRVLLDNSHCEALQS